jgi:hypothetical protein
MVADAKVASPEPVSPALEQALRTVREEVAAANARAVRAETEAAAIRSERDHLLPEIERGKIERRALEERCLSLARERSDIEESARRILADRSVLEVTAATARAAQAGLARRASASARTGWQTAADLEDELRDLLERALTRKGVEKLLSKAGEGSALAELLEDLLENGKLPPAGMFRSAFQ